MSQPSSRHRSTIGRGPAAAVAAARNDDPVSSIRFLLHMAQNFEDQGNMPESVKSAESALLLRRANEPRIAQELSRVSHEKKNQQQQQAGDVGVEEGGQRRGSSDGDIDSLEIPQNISEQAKELVLRCNSYAVAEFNIRHFDAATYFLNKCLFLTDNGTEKTAADISRSVKKMMVAYGGMSPAEATALGAACFAQDEEERLRLRAATFNNLGCMERRRGRIQESLEYLRKAIQIEARLDPSGTSSASTYLNLCTVLNALSRHAEAVAAAERAVVSVQEILLEQSEPHEVARFAMMLAVGQYNLGVSLEKRGKKSDAAAAQRAYQQSLETSRRYLAEGAECSTVEAALEAIRRMKNLQGVLDVGDSARRNSAFSASGAGSAGTASDAGGKGEMKKNSTTTATSSTPADQVGGAAAVAAGTTAVPPQQHGRNVTALSSSALSPFPSTGQQQAAAPYELSPVPPPSALLQRQHMSATYSGMPPSTHQSPLALKHTQRAWIGESATAATMRPMHSSGSGIAPSQRDSDVVHSAPNRSALAGLITPMSAHSPDGAQVRGGGVHRMMATPLVDPSMNTQRGIGNIISATGSGNPLLKPPRVGPGPLPPTLAPLAHRPQEEQEQNVPQAHPFGRRLGTSSCGGSPTSVAAAAAAAANRSGSGVMSAGAGGSRMGSTGDRPPALAFSIQASSTGSQRSASGSGNHSGGAAVIPAIPDILNSGSSDSNSGAHRRGLASGGISGSNLPPLGASKENPFGRRTFSTPLTSNPSASITNRNSEHGGNSMAQSGGPRHSSTSGAIPNTPLSVAKLSRSTRLQQQQQMKEKAKSDKAKRLQERIRRDERRRQMKVAADEDAELANELYESMVAGMKEGELRRSHNAAVCIQAMWRGVMTRSYISATISAAVTLQRATRRFLERVRAQRATEAAARAIAEAEQQKRELAACRVLQARVRQFLRRVQIRREYIARQRRRFFAARTIQRAYKQFCRRRAAHIAAVTEANRREDAQKVFRQRVAARRIQVAYRTYVARHAELAMQEEQQRRARNATTIQALVRGVLTRAWFRYYRAYRRNQDVRSAASQRCLVLIQSAARGLLAGERCRQRQVELLFQLREKQLATAATRIQCMWRVHVAKIRYARLEAGRAKENRMATMLQRWYATQVQRRAFLQYREEQQRLRAAVRIQRWLRECRQQAKEKEFAAYHEKLLREQRLKRLQQESILVIQACCYARESLLIVNSVRRTFYRNETCALLWQRVGRGYIGRKRVALDIALAHQIRLREIEHVRRIAASLVIQRAWRCAAAKDRVEQLRREKAAVMVLQRAYRCYKARSELRTLREEKRLEMRSRAAVRVQRAFRAWRQHKTVVENSAYYRTQHVRDMARRRREEAVTQIQALWRGYVTRREVSAHREVLRGLGVYASRIQRAWRARIFKHRMQQGLTERVTARGHHTRAVLTLQCFWRKMAAAERVARMREESKRRHASAIVVQRWWRGVLARRCRAQLLAARIDEERAMALYAIRWERAATAINAVLRARQCTLECVERHRRQLLDELDLDERVRFLLRGKAAVRIQAVYRGHYERMYVRGLIREREEQRRREAERAERRRRAAVAIQCAYRQRLARQAVRAKLDAKAAELLQAHEEFIATANPKDIVKELFWAHAAAELRGEARARQERRAAREAAAILIQRNFRRWTSRAQVTHIANTAKQQAAALVIQSYWSRHRTLKAAQVENRQEQAALTIQKHVRGWIVRREWARWRAAAEEDRRMHVTAEDVLDHAATVIQSFWRRIAAQERAKQLRVLREEAKSAKACEEAAAIIQEAFRTSRHVLRSSTSTSTLEAEA